MGNYINRLTVWQKDPPLSSYGKHVYELHQKES